MSEEIDINEFLANYAKIYGKDIESVRTELLGSAVDKITTVIVNKHQPIDDYLDEGVRNIKWLVSNLPIEPEEEEEVVETGPDVMTGSKYAFDALMNLYGLRNNGDIVVEYYGLTPLTEFDKSDYLKRYNDYYRPNDDNIESILDFMDNNYTLPIEYALSIKYGLKRDEKFYPIPYDPCDAFVFTKIDMIYRDISNILVDRPVERSDNLVFGIALCIMAILVIYIIITSIYRKSAPVENYVERYPKLIRSNEDK